MIADPAVPFVGKLLGRANVEGQKVYFSVPAATGEGDCGIAYHEASMKLILRDLGYTPTAIEEGLAVVFGELGASNFTGIGVSCGSGLCNACLAVLSVPVLTFAVPKAGDFIDKQAAAVTGDLATRLRVVKERRFPPERSHRRPDRQCPDGLLPGSDRQPRGDAAHAHLGDAAPAQAGSGHPAGAERWYGHAQGLPGAFSAALQAQDFPVRLSEVRLSADPLNSTARGALMAAMC